MKDHVGTKWLTTRKMQRCFDEEEGR